MSELGLSTTSETRNNPILVDTKTLPFAMMAVIWWALGAIFTNVFWFSVVWLICVFDFFAIFKTIACVLALMSDGQADKKAVILFQTLFWGFMKLACLGLLGGLLMMSQKFEIPQKALLMGLGTLIVVPLFGGFWWSRSEIQQGEQVCSHDKEF